MMQYVKFAAVAFVVCLVFENRRPKASRSALPLANVMDEPKTAAK